MDYLVLKNLYGHVVRKKFLENKNKKKSLKGLSKKKVKKYKNTRKKRKSVRMLIVQSVSHALDDDANGSDKPVLDGTA